MITTPRAININASKIDLSNQSLREFPTDLLKCKNLRKLNLSNNEISNLPKEISKLKRLESLDISNNKISILYSKLFELTNLNTLIINNNLLKKLPKQINNLKKLKKLSLASNDLKDLPHEISGLTNLKELNISNNPIITFPSEILSLKTLNTLWINKNRFNNFPVKDIVTNLPNLNKLYCYSALWNGAEQLDEGYLSLTKNRGNSIYHLKTLAEKPQYNSKINKISDVNFEENIMKTQDSINISKHNIFISYSHTDKKWLKVLIPFLKGMVLEGSNLDYWDDTKLKLGGDWKEDITKALHECHTAILLISQDFLASDFIHNDELPIILKKAQSEGLRVYPIILSPCRFTKIPSLERFQALNDPKAPLNSLKEHEVQEALLQLTIAIDGSLGK